MSFLEVFAQRKTIDDADLARLEERLGVSPHDVEQFLLERGVTQEEILQAKGEYYKMPTRSLGEEKIPFEVLKTIPEDSVLHYTIVPLGVADQVLHVGITDPDNIEARDAVSFIASKLGMPYKIFLISEGDFKKVLEMYKGLSGEVQQALGALESELDTISVKAEPKERPQETDQKEESETGAMVDAPVTKIVATMLRYATEGNASDIHVEPMTERVRVRFRVDGVLYTSLVLPVKVHRAVVARVKILSNIKLDERRKPQDGRFSAKIAGRKIDFRVSTFPTYYGEKVVIRILDREKGVKKLEEIGFSERNLKIVRDAMKRPYGLVLISGPTGSGKSTTLYAMLNELDREQRNILSLEDPVEYNVEGVSQSQVMPEIGYTFASGLRSTLRQDPDIIMVGEIRDKETAQLAIQAALTGHLVFSTIHTNTAIGVIPRLVDMGVDPYLIAPTLILALGQRLVRQLCEGAGKPVVVEGARRVMIDKQFEDLPDEFKKDLPLHEKVHELSSTKECPSGTRGRVGVFEALPMNAELETTLLKDPTEPALYAIARKQGMLTMKEDAILKSVKGVIPFEEANTL